MKPFAEVFHAHFYFTEPRRESALLIRSRLESEGFPVEFGRVHLGLVGPHTLPMYTLVFKRENFTDIVTWLMQNHGDHSVLIHPESGDDLIDHTTHALWLGERLPIDVSAF